MFFNWVGPRSWTERSSLPLTCQKACSERQIAPGLAMLSSRAAMLTPSPSKCVFFCRVLVPIVLLFHATPGYETYKGLGWFGVIQAGAG